MLIRHRWYLTETMRGFEILDVSTRLVIFAIENLLFNLTSFVHQRNFHRTNRVAVVTTGKSPKAFCALVVFLEPIFCIAIAGVRDGALNFGEGVETDKFGVDFAGFAE